jgi:uncharacterized protein (TIGR02391 family)
LNLETRIPNELWLAIKINYEKRNFTGAILDAFHYLSDLIRKKSGAEGDGSALIGSALGGATPKIKLNRLQSDSEWSVQKGMEQTLRGIYQAIRNPRSHEKISDTDEDAQIIIIFLGYIVRQLDLAKSQFSREDFLKRVLDPDFVPQERYSELLTLEIPPAQRLETFLDIYRAKSEGKTENLRFFFCSLLPKLSNDELIQVYSVISDELKTVDDESTIRIVLGSLGTICWEYLDEAARLRIENRLIRSIKEGRYNKKQNRIRDGALGTWIIRILPSMLLKQETLRGIYDCLNSSSTEREDYIFEYIFSKVDLLSKTIPANYESLVVKKIKAGDERFYHEMLFHPWQVWGDELTRAFNDFVPAEPKTDSLDDDIIF